MIRCLKRKKSYLKTEPYHAVCCFNKFMKFYLQERTTSSLWLILLTALRRECGDSTTVVRSLRWQFDSSATVVATLWWLPTLFKNTYRKHCWEFLNTVMKTNHWMLAWIVNVVTRGSCRPIPHLHDCVNEAPC